MLMPLSKQYPISIRACSLLTPLSENFSAFEIDEELLPNLQEYALANAIYWGLAEGHACEQSARRNAMDVSDRIPVRLIFWTRC